MNTDIASHIHLIKHRIGVSVNTESARYKELHEDKYYLPQDWAKINLSKDVYPPECVFDYYDTPYLTPNQTWLDALTKYVDLGNKLYHQCLEDLTPKLGRKRAKRIRPLLQNL